MLTEAEIYDHAQLVVEAYGGKPTEGEMCGCMSRFLRDFADDSQLFFQEFVGNEEE